MRALGIEPVLAIGCRIAEMASVHGVGASGVGRAQFRGATEFRSMSYLSCQEASRGPLKSDVALRFQPDGATIHIVKRVVLADLLVAESEFESTYGATWLSGRQP